MSKTISPKTPEDLFELFSQLNINVTTLVHEPLFTASQGQHIKTTLPGSHNKNLFLKNKKGAYHLITMLDDKRLDLKTFSQELGCGPLSFASDTELMSHLGIEPGHVTPFALINPSANNVNVILDKEMLVYDLLNFHPLKNHMTTTISRNDFLKFLEHLTYQPLILSLPKLLI